ncbi:APC family permease [Rhodococcus sp. G-MC3]|uniref:APC family permease n=1 Tax=Rhodococcus sp. G-MC3 TaxID=3046209 RepID=UPI0024BA7287|nr:APC family permease [Rhodococcus sp. G-MC3]MDJ0395102.1 APC family permease [Rhodococcus sp. G-MC3]
MNTSALAAALQKAALTERPTDVVRSPLSALGRKQLTPFDLVGQSMSTMAPATCMVFIALWMSSKSGGAGGMLAIIGATVVMAFVALCIRQFTCRLAASGSLYSFVAHGLGKRATLTAGAALLVGYFGVSISVLSNSGANLVKVGNQAGLPLGAGASVVGCVSVALGVALIAVRGVRVAARTIVVIEVCTIVLISVLMLRAPVEVSVDSSPASAPIGFVLFLAMQTVLSLAGFESAAFFGPEARKPLRSVTSTILVTPMLVGTLYVFAGWAGMSGHAGVLINAYFGGTETGSSMLLVLAVNIGVCSSWIASTLGFAQAGSRLLFSMSLERVIPGFFERVHPRFRSPYAAVGLFVGASLLGSLWHDPDHALVNYDVVVEIALILGYTMVAVAALRFLDRIGEHTVFTRASGLLAAAAGTGLLTFAVIDTARSGAWLYLVWCVALAASGSVWFLVLNRYRPRSIDAIGLFDSVETEDLLPGASSLRIDDDGKPVLTAISRRR